MMKYLAILFLLVSVSVQAQTKTFINNDSLKNTASLRYMVETDAQGMVYISKQQNGSATTQTTGSTPTTIATIPIEAGEQVQIVARVVGISSGNSMISGSKNAALKNVAGTLSIVGSVGSVVSTVANAALSTASFTVTTSGTNAII